MRGLFVTGTGTGVGKTIVSAALLAAMRAAGEPVRAHKPVVTGLAEPPGFGQSPKGWPPDQPEPWPPGQRSPRQRSPDHELLALAAGMTPEAVAPLRFDPPVSPHLAAALVGQSIDAATLIARARAAGSPASRTPTGSGDDVEPSEAQAPVLIVEGVGGLLVPITDDFSVRDLAVELGLPLLIAASPGLGTINHALLTLEAARAASLSIAAVVLTPWPAEPSEMEHSNRDTIARLGAIKVATLEEIASPDIPALALAGDRLPWRDWLSRMSFVATHP